ncbi:MAG: serine hydrolase [Clostridia bacterium]|nr:serine hydrolase [Clostridia bacterium]
MKQEIREGLRAAIQDLTERYQQAGYFSDASVRVFDDEKSLCTACVGQAKEDSWFDVASLTKIATATQVLHLIQQGRLSLETRLMDHLTEIAERPSLAEKMNGITLRQLLTHTSHLPAWFPFYSELGKDFFEVLEIALDREGLVEGMVYSDLNFMLLGKLLERLGGKPLARCLQEDLVEPYHLGGMTYLPEGSLDLIPSSYGNPIERDMCAERGITFDGFRPEEAILRGEVNDGNSWYYFGGVSGHAGIFAQTEAYARLCQLYLRSTDPMMIDAQREQPGAPGRGLGLQTGLSYPHGCGHTGFTGTGIYFSRELNIGVVSFTNRLFVRQKCEGQTWEYRRVLQEMVAAAARMG